MRNPLARVCDSEASFTHLRTIADLVGFGKAVRRAIFDQKKVILHDLNTCGPKTSTGYEKLRKVP
jgi:hypothetical protein